MKDYKRLTAQKEDRYWEQEEFWQSAREPSYEEIEELYSRLSELEEKIENGTLIELPCKVGDTVYHLSDKKICEEVVKQIKYSIYNGEIDLFNSHIMTDDNYSKDYNFYRVSKLGKSLFLTKSEAEAKLKELQGEQQ